MQANKQTIIQKTLTSSFKNEERNIPGMVQYAGFNTRMMANLIDCIIIGVLFFPLFSIMTSLINEGHQLPSEMLNETIVEIGKFAEQNQEVNIQNSIFNNTKFMDYFFKDHGLMRVLIDQFLQLAIVSGVVLYFWIKKQATPGKICLSIRIVDAKTLDKPTNKQLIKRIFGYFISALPLFLGMIWISFDKKKQGWHDKFAHTVVIKNVRKKKTDA